MCTISSYRGGAHRPTRRIPLCDTQRDIDYFWDNLSNDGDPQAQLCGWLKDKYRRSWQVIPRIMPELFKDQDSAKAQRAMDALLRTKKITIAELEQTATVESAGRS